MGRIKLKVYGITYSQVQSGAYALVLSQVDGSYRIPIVIGVAEAQSIAIILEHIKPSRPMSHDLFVSLSHGFGIQHDEVFIYKFKDGIFFSELKFSDEDRQITIDSRTSDAIALSLRTGAPIYTTKEILEEAGFVFTDVTSTDEDNDESIESQLEDFTVEDLEKMMQHCAEVEDYEKAAEIKLVITRKREEKNKSN